MKKILLLLFMMGGIHQLSSQPPDHFYTYHGGPGLDRGYGIQEIFDRQYIVVGSTTSFGNGGTDAYLFLLDSMGTMIWQKAFGGVGADVGKSVLFNPADSGFVFAGFTSSFGNGGFDVYVVRTDKTGGLKWQASFGGLDWDFGSDLAFASDGNIIVCGNTYSGGYGKNDGYLVKVNINTGGLIREKRYGGIEDDEFNRIKPTSDGNLCLSGNTKSYGDLNNDFWFFKINNNVDSVTSRNLGASNKQERCYDFMEDKVNNLVFCGSYDTSAYNTGKNISYILKTGLNGVFIDDHKVSGAFTDDDKFTAIANTRLLNDYFFARKVFYTGGVYEHEVQPYLFSANYIFLAATTYGGPGDDEVFKVIHTKDNGFAMIGNASGFTPSEDVLFIKLKLSVAGANLHVGLEENEPNVAQAGRMYYYDGAVYFENPKGENLFFEVVNSSGQIVQAGSTSQDYFLVKELANDFYLVRATNKPALTTRFIKN